MAKTHLVYRTRAWRAVRVACLVRDGYRCQIGLAGCKGRASQADHVVELADGGEWFALGNLQAACRSCNVAKRNKREAARQGRASVRVW